MVLDLEAAYANNLGVTGIDIQPGACGTAKTLTFSATYAAPLPDGYASEAEVTADIAGTCTDAATICGACVPDACATAGGYSPGNVLDVYQALSG
jgi:hypothetical protein